MNERALRTGASLDGDSPPPGIAPFPDTDTSTCHIGFRCTSGRLP
jgi:hypothetical protein